MNERDDPNAAVPSQTDAEDGHGHADGSTAQRHDPSLTDTWTGEVPGSAGRVLEVPPIPGYRMIRLLGRGGMGFVVQAEDLRLNRFVALKMPLPGRVHGPEERARFLREARSAARLRHPGICPIHEIGEVGGQPYLTLAFIAGSPLSQWAKEHSISARRIAEIVAAIAEAVHAAHEQGVVHRDLKPSNVMMEQGSDQPILMDFGLAKDLDTADAQLTQAGEILGTPAYMAPEQALGETATVGPATDIYGLGAILYWLLCGRAPFTGSFHEVIRMVQSTSPGSPRVHHPGLHRDLETICCKAMAREPIDRYPTALELAEDLRRFANGNAILARPDGWLRQSSRFVRRRPAAVASVVGLLATAILVAGLALHTQQTRQVSLAEQQFNRLLDQDVWTASQLQSLDHQIAVLANLSPAVSLVASERLHRRFRESLQQSIQHPSLTPRDLEQIRNRLALLQIRDADATRSLHAELEKRLRAWFPVLELQTPVQQLPNYLDRLDWQLDDNHLVASEKSDHAAGDWRKIDIEAGGNVEIQARFPAVALAKVQRLGVGFSTPDENGYQFVISCADTLAALEHAADETATPQREVDSVQAATDSLAQQRMAERPIELLILRNGQVVRRRTITMPLQELSLLAQRQGDRLLCQVNQLPALIFEDILPLGSREPLYFGVVLPAGGAISQLVATRQALPSEPSPLEHGDFLMANREYQQAYEKFREQDLAASFTIRQEARTKQAICLLETGRLDDGTALLEAVSGEPGDRWPMVAACYLWMLRLQQRRYDDAELVRELLASRYDAEQLARLLPDGFRKQVLREYLRGSTGTNLAGFQMDRLEQMRRAVDTERLIVGTVSPTTLLGLQRGYRMAGQQRQALQVVTELLKPDMASRLDDRDQVWLIEEYCWMLRLEDRSKDALAELNRHLAKPRNAENPYWRTLLIERARVHLALGDPQRAQADLQAYLDQVPAGIVQYRHHSAAHLLLGVLLQDQGDESAAQETWLAGLYSRWYPHYKEFWDTLPIEQQEQYLELPELPSEHPHFFSGVEFVQFAMLASLTQTLTQAEAQQLFRWLMFRTGNQNDTMVASIATLLQRDLVHRTFIGLCGSPRGTEVARTIAMQTITLEEFVHHPIYLMLYEVVRQGAFQAHITADQEAIVWRTASLAHQLYSVGQVSQAQILPLVFTWKGQTGSFGWDAVAGNLEPTLRDHLAYIFAHRMLQLKKPADAIKMFQVVISSNTVDSSLQAQAQGELNRLP